jgi:hypothetical protein
MSPPRYQTEHQHCLPPTDRWAVGTLQPMVSAIRATLHQLPTDRLDGMAAIGTVCPQFLDKPHNEENAV